jgi:hypothetical protein
MKFFYAAMLLILSSCLLTKQEQKYFIEKLVLRNKVRMNSYLVLRVTESTRSKEICIPDWALEALMRKEGVLKDEDNFNLILKPILTHRYKVIFFKNVEELVSCEISDSLYETLSKQGIKNVVYSYIKEGGEIVDEEKYTDKDLNAIIKYLFENQYIVGRRDFGGELYVVPPPHTLPIGEPFG